MVRSCCCQKSFMDNKFKLIIDSFGKERFKENEPLKDHTALGVGGPARLFFIAFTVAELAKIIKICRQIDLPFFLFGTGSKSMISDRGFEGIVIQNKTRNIHTVSVKGKVSKFGIGVEEAFLEVESGVSLQKFRETLDAQGFSSQEFSGITGSLGGNLFVSHFLQTRVKSIKVLDQNNDTEELEALDLSRRKHTILSVVLKVKAKEI